MQHSRRLLLLGLCLTLGFTAVHAQKNKRKSAPSADQMQFWIGMKGGINFSAVEVDQSYYVYEPLATIDNDEYDKDYDPYSTMGTQFGVVLGMEFPFGLSVSLEPSYSTYKFDYKTSYSWTDTENAENNLQLDYQQDHTLSYVEFPLLLRYSFDLSGGGSSSRGTPQRQNRGVKARSTGSFSPFIQFGALYGILSNSTKTVNTTASNQATGASIPYSPAKFSVGVDDLLVKSQVALIGGAGIDYQLGNVKVGLQLNYTYGMTNMASAKNRYTDYALITGVSDVFDDMKLRSFGASIHVLFPLKFITSNSFQAL